MKKGMALEGYIVEDKTVRPMKHYDDTELREKIQTNTDEIDNLDSRVTELEEHGGVEDPTKADKVEDATAGNLASLDENGNLQDSGNNPADFAPAAHAHSSIVDTYSHTDNGISVDNGGINISVDNGESDGETDITAENIGNLHRALKDPSSILPEDDNNKLITSKAVHDALVGKMSTTPVLIAITRSGSSYPLKDEQGTEQDLNAFIAGYPENKHFICSIEIDNGSGKGYATGVVYWEYKSSDNEILVHVRIGAKEFVAAGQSGGTSVSQYATAWTLNDYEQDFF